MGPQADTRCVAHLDMDAFYASVELLRHPQLADQPLVIGGAARAVPGVQEFPRLRDYAGRGVVTTANYVARRYGVHSAMGLMRAAQLCPQALLLPADFAEYRRYSALFKQVIADFTPWVEDRGIDEVYIDFGASDAGRLADGRVLAERIQSAIRAATGLRCSIGIGPNKLIAKIASELAKPNGIAIVRAAELAARIWPLPCRSIQGIGPKGGARLEQHGIRTVGDLAGCERAWLMQRFGARHGAWMHAAAWGRDERPVVLGGDPVSVSRETTFERDLHAVYDRPQLRMLFTSLCERVARDLQRNGWVGRTIGVKLRYENFQRATRDRTVEFHTNDAAVIRRIAGQCLARAPLTRRLRLLGVRVGGLARVPAAGAPREPVALPLFAEDPAQVAPDAIPRARG